MVQEVPTCDVTPNKFPQISVPMNIEGTTKVAGNAVLAKESLERPMIELECVDMQRPEKS
jgi:hypothetical protein